VQARRRLPSHVRLVVADAEALPFAAGAFDLAVSSSSFHYWPSPREGLSEIYRILRRGGVLVITDWCDDYLACKLCDRVLRWLDPAHHQIYGETECLSLLNGAEYEKALVDRYRISWLWGLMTATAQVPVA
jgi:ubiquinone/menaquinone biosynthesis C-methylase UbiE